MVIGAFPVAKLGVLAIKQISKPIANILKNRAKHSPFFRWEGFFIDFFLVKTKMSWKCQSFQLLRLHASCSVLQLVWSQDEDVGDEPGKTNRRSKGE